MVSVDTVQIPNRSLFRQPEICEIAQVQPYVLRSWEAEFPDLGVAKTAGGPRVYRRADLERVLRIKYLLFVEGLTLAGARRRLADEQSTPTSDPTPLDDLLTHRRARAHPVTCVSRCASWPRCSRGGRRDRRSRGVRAGRAATGKEARARAEKAAVKGRRRQPGFDPASQIEPASTPTRDVAQPGSAPDWGSGGRGFESRHPDHFLLYG